MIKIDTKSKITNICEDKIHLLKTETVEKKHYKHQLEDNKHTS